MVSEQDNSVCKNFINIIIILATMVGLSLGSYTFCTWYGCNSWTSVMGADLICNGCVNAAYHIKNFQIVLYGSMFSLFTYKITSLVNKASSPTDTYIFEEYILGKNSPRRPNVKK